MRRIVALVALAGAALLGATLLAGCGLKGITKPLSAPHTIIFIDGPVSAVNHIAHLHWFGSDANGYVVGYEVRLLNPDAPTDTAWRFTTRTDSVITVLTPTGSVSAVFEARAINDRGVRDPQPAQQRFDFTNQPPRVLLTGKPNAAEHSDTTFASVTVDWSVSDPDGNASKVIFQIWLDGQADSPLIVTGSRFTMPSARFLKGGVYKDSLRTLYIRGIDDGGMAGPVDSVTWFVRQPVRGTRAKLLLVEDVDDVPAGNKQSPPSRFRVDTLYANAIARTGLPADSWSMLRLDLNHPFRSSLDLQQTLQLFDAVVWYRGEQLLYSNVLATYGDGIGPYLDGGGRMFIESLNLTSAMSTYGALSPDFVSRYLNSDGVHQYALAPDSSAAWGLSSAAPVVLVSPPLADSVQNLRTLSGLRAFRTRDASQILLVARAHALSQDNPFDMPVALDVRQANGGRLIVDSYPLVSGTISTATFPQRASLLLSEILARLGIAGP